MNIETKFKVGDTVYAAVQDDRKNWYALRGTIQRIHVEIDLGLNAFSTHGCTQTNRYHCDDDRLSHMVEADLFATADEVFEAIESRNEVCL